MRSATEQSSLRARLRTGPHADLALLVAFVVGVALASVHWAGLAVGGALVGLLAPTFTRALWFGLYLGIAVAVAFAAYLALFGALTQFLASGELAVLSLVIALAVPTLAASVRALG
ncbi:hypothetical protein [Halomarina litorea]|uniref:hypothetical protein n=1 Tax=Halomarina litorea TaxID=2961595 RepID=UPI0020C44CC6|nr:hypothetical protein [Halomarina sp. BCD28]